LLGLPDKRHGEELSLDCHSACETLSEAEIIAGARGEIAHDKVPRYIRSRAGFPMTLTSKIRTFKIRDEMKNQLGLKEDPTD
jgi:fatty-acyl-CoA synthase